jgi:hypothetical protein
MLPRTLLTVLSAALVTLLVLVSGTRWGRADAAAEGKAKKADALTSKELIPRTFTLQEKEISLNKALAELARQTGNSVEDRRQAKGDNMIKLSLQNVTFWQALDAIAKAADAKVSVYERDGKIALIDGPHQTIPISYSGLFRVTVKRIDVISNMDTDDHECLVYLQVAWEPRFRPLMMEPQPMDLVVQDDKGRALEVPEMAKGAAPIGHRTAAEIRMRFEAPRRSANQLGLLKGKLVVLGPSKQLTFTLDNLRPIEKAAERRKETQDGVALHLRELRTEGEAGEQIWTVGLLLEYPPEGPKFESFQSWWVNNEIYLEKEKEGLKQRFPPNLGYETDDQGENKALIRYRFGDEAEKNLLLGKLGEWKIVYQTPGRIVQLPIPFEFKDLPLP